jgi:UPF0755 protein
VNHRAMTAPDELSTQRTDRRRRRRQGKRKSAAAVLLAFVVVLGVLGGAVYGAGRVLGGLFEASSDYTGPGTAEVIVEIEPGQSTRSIGATLEEHNVVKSSGAFVAAARDDGRSGGIQPGFYRLMTEMKASLALGALLDEANRINNPVTVREGLRLTQMLAALAEGSRLPLADFEAAIADPAGLGLVPYAAGKPEGFLFPATYDVTPGSTAAGILQEMARKFGVVAGEIGLEQRAAALGRTPLEIVTIASLIQAEVRNLDDFPKVARVVYNRLDAGMHLQFDSTVHYAAGETGNALTTSGQRAIDSPYNTYKYVGLPPGPINNPGQAALEAALNPAAGDWLYFVTVNLDTGETKFATTDAEHAANVAELQEWLRNNP